MPKSNPRGRKNKAPAFDLLKRSQLYSTSATKETLDNDSSPLFFYGHKNPPHDFLSQHFLCTFNAPASVAGKPDITFQSTEQYMMYHKAILFEDVEISEKITKTTNPVEQKKLGRLVAGFTPEIWGANRERIVEKGNWYKFTNATDPNLKTRLLGTGDRELVEAAPRDRIWGIGFGKLRAATQPRNTWGLNLLGKVLMKVRDRLRAEDASKLRT